MSEDGDIIDGITYNQRIFREYDIRGIVGTEFDSALARALGRVYADQTAEQLLGTDCDKASKRKRLRVAVGTDCRTTTEDLESALILGLLDGGVSVVRTGMGPTPQLYFAVFSEGFDAGIQITASHNPGEYNGFKMMIGSTTLSGDAIQQLRRRIDELDGFGDRIDNNAEAVSLDVRSRYIAKLIDFSKDRVNKKKKLRVVVDGGNGVGGLVGPEVLRGLGCEVIELFTEPDGTFPNHHPDPTELKNLKDLQKCVVENNADVGIAWDGDADRMGVVDENGTPIFGDMLLIIFGRHLLKEVKHPVIIGDVKCSELLFQDLQKRGAKTVMSRTGHSLIKQKIKEINADLAGEMSGHFYLVHNYYRFDDALRAATGLVEILSHSDVPMSKLLADLPKMYTTPEIRVDCADELKFAVAERAKDSFPEFKTNPLDGVRITFPHGWGLVRASNTQPALIMRFEADSSQALAEYQTQVTAKIESLMRELS